MVRISVAEIDCQTESPRCLLTCHQYSKKQDTTSLLHEKNIVQTWRKSAALPQRLLKENSKLVDLIKAESDSVEVLTITEHIRTRGQLQKQIDEEHRITRIEVVRNVSQHIESLQSSYVTFTQGTQLMKSLEFPGRNKRLNDIVKHTAETFQWLFDSRGDRLAQVQPEDSDLIYKTLVQECQSKT